MHLAQGVMGQVAAEAAVGLQRALAWSCTAADVHRVTGSVRVRVCCLQGGDGALDGRRCCEGHHDGPDEGRNEGGCGEAAAGRVWVWGMPAGANVACWLTDTPGMSVERFSRGCAFAR